MDASWLRRLHSGPPSPFPHPSVAPSRIARCPSPLAHGRSSDLHGEGSMVQLATAGLLSSPLGVSGALLFVPFGARMIGSDHAQVPPSRPRTGRFQGRVETQDGPVITVQRAAPLPSSASTASSAAIRLADPECCVPHLPANPPLPLSRCRRTSSLQPGPLPNAFTILFSRGSPYRFPPRVSPYQQLRHGHCF